MLESVDVVSRPLESAKYYRMPWTLTDNAMSWLEITTQCNVSCRGCYRDMSKEGHKSLAQVQAELDVFKKYRKSDGMSIAGGDPLVHPEIVEVVKRVSGMGFRPLINTNGLALTPELLHELRKAGAAAFTFHIDTTMKRRDLPGAATEEEYLVLRKRYADMLAAEGGVTCGFNVTVTRKNLHEVPTLVRWAEEHADRVHSFHFITYRDFGLARDFDLFAHGRRFVQDLRRTNPDYYTPGPVTTQDVVDQIRLADPLYEPGACLGGTCKPDSLKWTFASRLVLKGKTLGYVGARFMKFSQHLKHFLTDKWFALPTPGMLSSGRSLLPTFFCFDSGVRASAFRYLKALARNPLNGFRNVHMQTILVLQPTDFLADGRMNMCEGCPDLTVHNGSLYWSCRLEEIKEFGTFLTASPRKESHEAPKRYFRDASSVEQEPASVPR